MGTTAEKLTHLSQTKSDIRDAIIAKGVSVPAETTFRDYATKVSDIKTDFSDTFNYAERVSQDGGSVENLAEVSNLDFNDGATLNFIPSGKKAGKSYSQLPADGSADWTVDRNCEATYIDKDGVMKTAQANEPRYDWSNGNPVLLREGQSTNLINWSEDFSNSSWNKGNVAVIENTISPDNSNTGSKFNITNIYHFLWNSFTVIAGIEYTFTFFAKKGTATDLKYCVYDETNAANIIPPTSYFSVVNNSNWSKIKVNFVAPNGCNIARVYPLRDSLSSGTVEIWGVQVEEGETTSYVKTEGSTVTRLADIIETIDGVEQTPITTIPATYQIPEGNINQIKML
jgi:hypothetical protein